MIKNVIKLSQHDIKFRKRATFSDKVARAATFPQPGQKNFAAPGLRPGRGKVVRSGPAGAAKFKFKFGRYRAQILNLNFEETVPSGD